MYTPMVLYCVVGSEIRSEHVCLTSAVLQSLHSQMDRDKARHDELVKTELLAHKEAVHEEVCMLRRTLQPVHNDEVFDEACVYACICLP